MGHSPMCKINKIQQPDYGFMTQSDLINKVFKIYFLFVPETIKFYCCYYIIILLPCHVLFPKANWHLNVMALMVFSSRSKSVFHPM